ncbi:MAG: MmgE/PrpD family protein, partial [Candidatus Hydrogenedentota bacterium]
MKNHTIRVYASSENLPKDEQFAYKLARMASDDAPIDPTSEEMVINRIIDNASVAMASVNRTPVENARSQALAHPRSGGATVFGMPNDQLFEAAWANGTAV